VETQRPDALFHDPLAAVLAGDRGKNIADAMPRSFMTAWAVVMRTCIIDDHIRLAIAEGADAVLNLGAGLDTRPYRIDLPASFIWTEADFPHIIDYKEKTLAHEVPRCQLTRVQCDLANPTDRRQVLADANARAKKLLVLTEGVVPYLSIEDAGSLADDLRKLDHAKYWLVDYFSPQLLKYRRRLMQKKLENAPFKFAPEDWLGFFRSHGWRCREIRYLADEADRLGRQIKMPPLAQLITSMRWVFMSKARRESFKKFAGYVLLEPGSASP
jgi:methyltransferase (TIGR00027 family)